MTAEIDAIQTLLQFGIDRIYDMLSSASSIMLNILQYAKNNEKSIRAGSIFVLAMGTIYAAWFVQRNVLRDKWLERQSSVYAAFWNNKDADLVRYWLICDSGYEDIKSVLIKRFEKPDGRNLTFKEYKKIEIIDRFLCELTRFREFDSNYMNHTRRKLWIEVFGHWINKIENRPEFKHYVKQCWKDADLLRPPKKSFRENMLSTFKFK